MSDDEQKLKTSILNAEGEVDFATVFQILYSQRYRIFAFALTVAFITGITNKFFIAPYYYSTTLIMPRSGQASGSSELLKSSFDSESNLGQLLSPALSNSALDHFEKFLKSRRLSSDVAKKIGPERVTSPAPGEPAEATQEKIHQALAMNLKIKSERNTLTIDFKHTSPQFANEVLNAYLSALEEYIQNTSITQAKAAELFIKSRLAESTEALRILEANYIALQKKTGVLEANSQASFSMNTAAGLRAKLVEKDMEIELQKNIWKDGAQLDKLRSERDQIQRQLDRIVSGGISKRADVLKPVGTLPEILSEFAATKREFMIQEKVVEYLRQQFEFAQIESKKNEPMFQIIDAPNIPYFRAGPNTRMNTIIAFIVSLVFACICGIIFHHFQAAKSVFRPFMQLIKSERRSRLSRSR